MNSRALTLVVSIASAAGVATAGSTARAQASARSCITPDSAATSLTLGQEVSVDDQCSVGLAFRTAAGGPHAETLPGSDGTNYLALVHALAERMGRSLGDFEEPPSLAVTRGAQSVRTSLRLCTNSIASEYLASRVSRRGRLEVSHGVGRCSAPSLSFFFVRAQGGDGNALFVSVDDLGEARLDPHGTDGTDNGIELPLGDYFVYAAPPDAPIAMRVGMLDSVSHRRDVVAWMRDRRGWLAPRWHGPAGATWVAAEEVPDHVVAELRLAGSIGWAWIEDDRGRRHALAGGSERAFRIPARTVNAIRAENVGAPLLGTSPTLAEWRDVLARLRLCVRPRYGGRAATDERARAPTCASMAVISAPPTSQARLRIRSRPAGLQAGRRARPYGAAHVVECSASSCATSVLLPGDELSMRSAQGPMHLCAGRRCRPIPNSGRVVVGHIRGVLEIRAAASPSAAERGNAFTVLRALVVDPERDWLPTGLDPRRTRPLGRPWDGVAWDGAGVVSIERPTVDLATMLEVRDAERRLLQLGPSGASVATELPLVGPVVGYGAHRAGAPLVTFVTDHPRCPSGSWASVRTQTRRPGRLVRDEVVFLTLAESPSPRLPVRCLATVAVRVRSPRTSSGTWPVQAALLEDAYIGVAVAEPYSVTSIWSLASTLMHMGAGVVLSVGVHVGASLGLANLAPWLGVGAHVLLHWGPREVPRLVVAGVTWQPLGADGVTLDRVQPFAGLDLTSVVDALAGL